MSDAKMTDVQVEEARSKGLNGEKLTIEDVANAKDATDNEHKLTARQGLKAYKKAIFWSVVFSMCIVMDGYGKHHHNPSH
jgi:MFS transporter, SP family, general alpha glucoside:H+ symporter